MKRADPGSLVTIIGVTVTASFFQSSSQQQPKNGNAFIYSVQLTIENH